jgi:aspartyl-tRNA(Asn)/glutamyl-tRNA(Gln) amidotransferase subunit A
MGSSLFSDYIPDEDSPAVGRLKTAGGILIGKTNTAEFGWLAITYNNLFGHTKNPWDRNLTPGGSSGGAAAAVASGMGPLALGSDSGGSIRIPASFSGIFGMKPSLGIVPMCVHNGFGGSTQYGPMTRTVSDAALMLSVMNNRSESFLESMKKHLDLSGLRIAWSPTFGGPVDSEVKSICEKAIDALIKNGWDIYEVEPDWPDPVSTWSDVFYGKDKNKLESQIKKAAKYIKEKRAREIANAWTEVGDIRPIESNAFYNGTASFFERFDLLLTPTVPCSPFPIGRESPDSIDGNSLRERFAWLRFLYPFNLTGQPAASVPCGFTKSGLPVGLQIVGKRLFDSTVLGAATIFEQIKPWAHARPAVE